MSYEIVGKFYDDIMSDQKESGFEIHKLIKKHHPKAETLLELACGTGSYLKHLSKHYDVSGLDNSSLMLSLARNKLKKIPLFQIDMLKFNFDLSFDAIICMNDSVNHLLKSADLQKLFAKVSMHLNRDGIFIFDINTEYKLSNLAKSDPIMHEFGKNYLITDISHVKNLYEWHLKIFEHRGTNKYLSHEETLLEKAYSVTQIKKSLSKYFKKIKVIDLEKKKVSERSARLHLVSVKK